MLKFDDKQKVALIKEIKGMFDGMNLVSFIDSFNIHDFVLAM